MVRNAPTCTSNWMTKSAVNDHIFSLLPNVRAFRKFYAIRDVLNPDFLKFRFHIKGLCASE